MGNAITQANGRGTVRIAHVRGIPRSAGIALFGEENPLAVGRDRHWQGPVLPTEIGFGFLAGRQSRNTTTPVLPDHQGAAIAGDVLQDHLPGPGPNQALLAGQIHRQEIAGQVLA